MSRPFRLTRQAEASLTGIARWIFGLQQADIYEAALISRCETLARGEASSRTCSVSVASAHELRFCRAGRHFLIFLEREGKVVIADVPHTRTDLPRHIAVLAQQDDGSFWSACVAWVGQSRAVKGVLPGLHVSAQSTRQSVHQGKSTFIVLHNLNAACSFFKNQYSQ